MFLQLHSLFFKQLKQANLLRYLQCSGLFLLTAVARKECQHEALFSRRSAAKIETLSVVENLFE